MTLDDAILHCKDIIENKSNNVCEKCIDVKSYRQAKESFNNMVNGMRDLTEEERIAYNKYIESISIPTGINFWDYIDEKEK